MRQLTRSWLLWFAAVTLAIVSWVFFRLSGAEYGWQPAVFAVLHIVSAAGVLLEKRWLAYFAAGLLAFDILAYASYMFPSVSRDYGSYDRITDLFPGAALVLMSILSIAAIHRFFRTQS
ncbi:hypothetical protein [Hyphomicrobium sp.]|uniref:hypothetical protein n=1 Tax=Hyphomicrobium sp. TaxID=82 RepID=UPI000FB0BB68|nr:hypothetical protein [Hyphomicrobium sp.]RUP07843.1 MAG: hypothetical protein EKK38_16970 [Hyphomicrobium sp.]